MDDIDPIDQLYCLPIEKIERLRKLEKVQNQGRGVQCVRNILMYLDDQKFDDAMTVAELDFDKIRQYPDIANLLRGWLVSQDRP